METADIFCSSLPRTASQSLDNIETSFNHQSSCVNSLCNTMDQENDESELILSDVKRLVKEVEMTFCEQKDKHLIDVDCAPDTTDIKLENNDDVVEPIRNVENEIKIENEKLISASNPVDISNDIQTDSQCNLDIKPNGISLCNGLSCKSPLKSSIINGDNCDEICVEKDLQKDLRNAQLVNDTDNELNNHSVKQDVDLEEKVSLHENICDTHDKEALLDSDSDNLTSKTSAVTKRDVTKRAATLRGVKYFDDESSDTSQESNHSENNSTKTNKVYNSKSYSNAQNNISQRPKRSDAAAAKNNETKPDCKSSIIKVENSDNRSNTRELRASRTSTSSKEKSTVPPLNIKLSGKHCSEALTTKSPSCDSQKSQSLSNSSSKYGLRRLDKTQVNSKAKKEKEILHITEEERFKVLGLEGVKCKFCKTRLKANNESIYHVRGMCKAEILSTSVQSESSIVNESDSHWNEKRLKIHKPLNRRRAVHGMQAKLRKCYIQMSNVKEGEDSSNKGPLITKISLSPFRKTYSGINKNKHNKGITSPVDNESINHVSDMSHDSKTKSSGEVSNSEPDSYEAIVDSVSSADEGSNDPCVCDGCGEIVPNCTWLTAHITACRAGIETIDQSSSVATKLPEPQSLEVKPEPISASESKTDLASEIALNSNISYDSMATNAQTTSALTYGVYDSAAALQQQFDATSVLQYLEANGNPVENAQVQNSFISNETTAVNGLQTAFDDFGENTVNYIGREITFEGAEMYEFIEYECDTCLLTLLNRRAALQHLQNSDHSQATVLIVYVYCCKYCTLRFRLKQDMWFHVAYLCQRKPELESEHPGNELEDQSSFYKCTLCNKSFYAVHYLRRHMYLYHSPVITGQLETLAMGGAQSTDNGISLPQVSGWSNEQTNPAAQASNSNLTTDPQALLDLACSMVLAGSSTCDTSATKASDVVPANTPGATVDTSALIKQQQISKTNQMQKTGSTSDDNADGQKTRRSAKGIVYKNVFMKCIVNYICSICDRDLSTKASKKEHKTSTTCFETSGTRRFTYVRHYSYLCPYCGDKFPTQKLCRQHQLSRCLLIMGVKTDELNFKQLLCPFCDKKYFNIITLKGHMTLVHKMDKYNSGQVKNIVTSRVIVGRTVAMSEVYAGGVRSGDDAMNENSNVSSDDVGFSMANYDENSME